MERNRVKVGAYIDISPSWFWIPWWLLVDSSVNSNGSKSIPGELQDLPAQMFAASTKVPINFFNKLYPVQRLVLCDKETEWAELLIENKKQNNYLIADAFGTDNRRNGRKPVHTRRQLYHHIDRNNWRQLVHARHLE